MVRVTLCPEQIEGFKLLEVEAVKLILQSSFITTLPLPTFTPAALKGFDPLLNEPPPPPPVLLGPLIQ